jgi:hypothetical protein
MSLARAVELLALFVRRYAVAAVDVEIIAGHGSPNEGKAVSVPIRSESITPAV